jgi:hypothetical protein
MHDHYIRGGFYELCQAASIGAREHKGFSTAKKFGKTSFSKMILVNGTMYTTPKLPQKPGRMPD